MINGWFISCKYEEISEYVWFNFVYKIIKKKLILYYNEKFKENWIY